MRFSTCDPPVHSAPLHSLWEVQAHWGRRGGSPAGGLRAGSLHHQGLEINSVPLGRGLEPCGWEGFLFGLG